MSHRPESSSVHDRDAQRLGLEDRDRDQGNPVSKDRPLHGARSHMLPY